MMTDTRRADAEAEPDTERSPPGPTRRRSMAA